MLSKPIACGEYPQYANKDKQRKILFVLAEYRKTAQEIAKYQWYIFFTKGKFHQKVAVIERNAYSKTFDYWLKVSTLEKGKLTNFCQLTQEDGKLKVRLVKGIEDKRDTYIPVVEEIGIDIGLRPLIATSQGDLIGRNFFEFLKSYDTKITKRMAELQRKGLKPSKDKKYREIVRRFREFLRSEINRHINRLIEVYRPKEVLVKRHLERLKDCNSAVLEVLDDFLNPCSDGNKFL